MIQRSHVLLVDQASALAVPVLVGHLPVGLRAQEPRVAVFGHQHVDPVLSHVEARRRGGLHVGFGDVPGLVVDIDLQRREGGEDMLAPIGFSVAFSKSIQLTCNWGGKLMRWEITLTSRGASLPMNSS